MVFSSDSNRLCLDIGHRMVLVHIEKKKKGKKASHIYNNTNNEKGDKTPITSQIFDYLILLFIDFMLFIINNSI